MVAPHSLGPARARGHWQVHKVVRPQVPEPRSPVAQRGRVAKSRRAVECHAECGQGQQHDGRDQLYPVHADVEVLRVMVLLMQVLACATPPRRRRACMVLCKGTLPGARSNERDQEAGGHRGPPNHDHCEWRSLA